jgi:hypothetical protein
VIGRPYNRSLLNHPKNICCRLFYEALSI